MFMSALPVHTYVYLSVPVRCPWKPEGGVRSSGTGVLGGCELLDVDGGNLGPLQEQPAFFTIEPFLLGPPHPSTLVFNVKINGFLTPTNINSYINTYVKITS